MADINYYKKYLKYKEKYKLLGGNSMGVRKNKMHSIYTFFKI